MDTKKYEALVTSVTEGSFTRAAEKLGNTQSGLTHMMNALESEVGFRMLERGHFGIRLTPDGQRIMPLIQNMLHAAEQLDAEIRAINKRTNETVHIGAYASIATHWLPPILDRFRRECPSVQVNVHDDSRELLFSNVLSGRFDLAFTSEPKGEPVNWIPLREDPLLALLPKSTYDEHYSKFAVEDFDGVQFLMPSFGNDADILAVLENHGVHAVIQNTSTSNQALISMVAHGLGMSILSELTIRGYEQSITALPLSPAYARTLGIITSKGAIVKPAVAQLIDCAKEVVGSMYGEAGN